MLAQYTFKVNKGDNYLLSGNKKNVFYAGRWKTEQIHFDLRCEELY